MTTDQNHQNESPSNSVKTPPLTPAPLWRRHLWKIILLIGLPAAAVLILGLRTYYRYDTATVMSIPVQEFTNVEYPEDPADRSLHHGKYAGRQLTLVQKDATHFDFIFEPKQPHIARIVVRDVDVSLITPNLPEWTKADEGLKRIALTDRQWNRQQVRFDVNSPMIEVAGGDGFEKQNLHSVDLAKNCLNAGLWEIQLFNEEGGSRKLYYQGWFTFPLGHYKNIFEQNTGLSYLSHWYYLEHWFDPAGTAVPMEGLRRVITERTATTTFDPSEKVIAFGEQTRKRRTTLTQNLVSWENYYDGRPVEFARFIPPGRYSVSHPRDTKYWMMDRFEKAIQRQVVSPASPDSLSELELVFTSSKEGGQCRFFVSGFDVEKLPRLPVKDYPQGVYMPMGIGVPPFGQRYDDLIKKQPQKSPYVSVFLDGDGRWIDHHSFGIDGPVLHRDDQDPNLLHVYLLSYERHNLIAHFVVTLS